MSSVTLHRIIFGGLAAVWTWRFARFVLTDYQPTEFTVGLAMFFVAGLFAIEALE